MSGISEDIIKNLTSSVNKLTKVMEESARNGNKNISGNGSRIRTIESSDGNITNIGRDSNGTFRSTDDIYNDFYESIEKIIKTNKRFANTVAENNESISRAERKYQSLKSSLTSEEQEEFERKISQERALLEEQEAVHKYEETVRKNKELELKNQAAYTRIREQNYVHEQELEKKRLEFQEANLAKTQAIAKKELDIQQIKQKYELQGYNKDGKKNSGAEIYQAIGKAQAYFKGNSAGRIAGDAIAKTGQALVKGTNFLASDDKVSVGEVGNKVAGIASNFGPWGQAVGAIAQLITAIVEAYDKVNIAASKYVRQVGGGAAKMNIIKGDAVAIAAHISKMGGNAYKFKEILEHTAELSAKTGRIMDHISELDFKSLEDLTRYGINSDVLNMYDTFGLSVETIDKRITSVYKKAGRHGLNAKAVTDAVNRNLKLAQQYTFAGGQRALERMAEKSVALKYNMESVARFADKVSTLEGAAQAGAGLSVLGGDFARMGNPLSLLYGGIQDPERLNEMMLNMTKNMAHWDSQLGEMRITAYNRQRLKAAAEYMGVDSNELINQALMQGKRNRIDSQIGYGITDEETREYIRNLAQLDEKGRAYIRFNGSKEPTYLDKLTPQDKERLQKESEAMEEKDKAKIGDIWQETRTINDRFNDFVDWMRSKFFGVILKIADYDEDTINAATKYGIYGVDEINQLKKGKRAYARNMAAEWGAGGALAGTVAVGAATGGIATLGGTLAGGLVGYGSGYINGMSTYNEDYAAKQYAINRERERLQKEYPDNQVKVETELKKYIESLDKKKDGGLVGQFHGRGTSVSDSNLIKISDGEFIMNASAAKKHLPTLQAWNAEGYSTGSVLPIRAGANQTNSMTVSNPGGSGSNQSLGIDTLKLEPISINLNGTIKLDAGNGITKNFNAKDLLNDNVFISKLIKEIEVATNYALDKTKSNIHMKYPTA